MPKAKIYGSTDDLIAGVSAETGVSKDDVRKVLRASFESTKNYVLQQLGEQASGKSFGKKFTKAELGEVAAGVGLVGQLSKFNQAALRAKLAGFVGV